MAKKRGHNEGSIYQRKNGSWRAMVTVEGKRLSHNAETKREAHAWVRKTLAQVDSGLTYQNAQITLEKFMKDWLIGIESTLRPKTIRQYQQITHQHILPWLGKTKLKDLKPGQIQYRYNQMVKQGKGLRTIQLTHSVLHRALVHAVKLGVIPRNPDDATTPPKPIQKEMKFFDQNQVHQLFITAKEKNNKHYALYYLAISTGLRQAEILGLKWADLDWDKRSLKIQRQAIQLKGGGFDFAIPKTKAGKRKIILGLDACNILQEHRQKQFQLMQAAGENWQDHDLIFTSEVGTPVDKYNLLKSFKKLLRNAGLPEIRFHDLRHTAASLMLNHNIPVIVVSRRLGHARPSITLDIYGHLIPGKQEEVAVLMDELLSPIEIKIEV